MTQTLQISSADLALLMPIVAKSIDLTVRSNNPMFDGDNTLTYSDAVASVINGIVSDPAWKTKALQSSLRDHAASARYQKEISGVTVNGAMVATDRQSQAMINGAVAMAQINSSFTTQWKQADGTFTTLNAAALIAIGTAVGNHIAACFAAEASVGASIASGGITTTAQIDAAFAAIAT